MLSINFTYRLTTLLMLFAGSMLLAATVQAGPYSALVFDPDSSRALFEQNADELRHPASLTKMMTLYIVFDTLEQRRLSLEQRLWISQAAVMRPPSKLGLRAGDSITVEEAILALVTQSANDAATVLAEGLGGTEEGFARQMTAKAQALGMTRTYFRNASGLPDPFQVTTAWDMCKLAMALQRQFPQYYTYFSTENFYFRHRIYRNHNHLLESYAGTDGIKTGYIRESGFNLVASARRNGHRLIGVVFGGETAAARDAHMRDILDQGFAQVGAGGPLWQATYRSYPPPPIARPLPAQQLATEEEDQFSSYPAVGAAATSAMPPSRSPEPAVAPEPAVYRDRFGSSYSVRNTPEPVRNTPEPAPTAVKPAPTDLAAVGDRFNGAYSASRATPPEPAPRQNSSAPAPVSARAVPPARGVDGYATEDRFNGAYSVSRVTPPEPAVRQASSQPLPVPARTVPPAREANGYKVNSPILLAQTTPAPKPFEEDSIEPPALPPKAASALPPKPAYTPPVSGGDTADSVELIGKPMYEEVTTESSVDQPDLFPKKSVPTASKPAPKDKVADEDDSEQSATVPRSTSTDKQSVPANKAASRNKADQSSSASRSSPPDKKSPTRDKATQSNKAVTLASTSKSKPVDKVAQAQQRGAVAPKPGAGRSNSVAQTTPAAGKPASCQLQVGAFSSKAVAEQQLSQASQAAPKLLSTTRAVVAPLVQGSKTLYRACFKGLSQAEAGTACQTLKRKQMACFAVSQGG